MARNRILIVIDDYNRGRLFINPRTFTKYDVEIEYADNASLALGAIEDGSFDAVLIYAEIPYGHRAEDFDWRTDPHPTSTCTQSGFRLAAKLATEHEGIAGIHVVTVKGVFEVRERVARTTIDNPKIRIYSMPYEVFELECNVCANLGLAPDLPEVVTNAFL